MNLNGPLFVIASVFAVPIIVMSVMEYQNTKDKLYIFTGIVNIGIWFELLLNPNQSPWFALFVIVSAPVMVYSYWNKTAVR